MKTHFRFLLALFLSVVLCGCSAGSLTPIQAPAQGNGTRGSTRRVLKPEAGGAITYGNEQITLDASHSDQGYIMLKWLAPENKLKFQISGPRNNTYTYNLPADGEWHTYPLTEGSGTYTLGIFENVVDNQYSQAFAQALTVRLANDFLPFLYPNEYVSFDSTTKAVALAEDLAEHSDTDLDVISSVFYYVVSNIDYDYDKAQNVQSGYLPDVDATLAEGKGICFDYAALMACMLRSQQIPTRLDIGYIGDVYHAWISIWVADQGWVYNAIEFDGTEWNMMDPTFTSTARQGDELKQYISNEQDYFIKYSY